MTRKDGSKNDIIIRAETQALKMSGLVPSRLLGHRPFDTKAQTVCSAFSESGHELC
jgi:hypothetical protein